MYSLQRSQVQLNDKKSDVLILNICKVGEYMSLRTMLSKIAGLHIALEDCKTGKLGSFFLGFYVPIAGLPLISLLQCA